MSLLLFCFLVRQNFSQQLPRSPTFLPPNCMCTKEFSPVCAVLSGITYNNRCQAKCHEATGVPITNGRCDCRKICPGGVRPLPNCKCPVLKPKLGLRECKKICPGGERPLPGCKCPECRNTCADGVRPSWPNCKCHVQCGLDITAPSCSNCRGICNSHQCQLNMIRRCVPTMPRFMMRR